MNLAGARAPKRRHRAEDELAVFDPKLTGDSPLAREMLDEPGIEVDELHARPGRIVEDHRELLPMM